jgi:hypothetical protein
MPKYSGGCDHVHTSSDKDPIDNHVCHCSVCKRVTGQGTTHVVFFNHGDLKVDNMAGLKRQPFNDQNPKGPLELCTCVPNLMGYEEKKLPATYHAFYDAKSGAPKPKDGRAVHEGLRPDFVWPKGVPA